jgi:hypothetical protein
MRSVALFLVVIAAVLIVTKWLAFVALLVIWSAWRAIKLSRHNPEWYGGYKTSAATLAITIAASATIAGYGIAHIPQALENYRTRQIAATQAAMYHFRGLLEEYKIRTGSYPRSAQQFKEAAGESAPLDYWERTIKYQTAPEAIADRLIGLGNRTPFNSFELRSAGPDGIIGTDDDIVMRDGIFFTNSEIKNQPVVQQLR